MSEKVWKYDKKLFITQISIDQKFVQSLFKIQNCTGNLVLNAQAIKQILTEM